MAKSKVDALK